MDLTDIRQGLIDAADQVITLEILPAWRSQGHSIGEIIIRPAATDPLRETTVDFPLMQIVLEQQKDWPNPRLQAPLGWKIR